MKLYTAEEAAEVLRVSKWTVWKYGREGKLRTVKFGRTVRYDLKGGEIETHRRGGDPPQDTGGHRQASRI